MLRLGVIALLSCLAMPAAALEFERCNKSQITYATDSVVGAREVILRASARVGDTPEFETWFGAFRPAHAEEVRQGLKSIDRALASDELVLICPRTGEDGCSPGTFANVWPDRPYRVNLCPAFFTMPTMTGVVRSSSAFDTGTREGTIIHEVSHFDRTAATEDNCYTRQVCMQMARENPRAVIENADSFQYFAEDVMFAFERETASTSD